MRSRLRARLRVLYARESASSLQSLLAFHVGTSRELWSSGALVDAPRLDRVRYAVGTRVSGHVELPGGAVATFQGLVSRCQGELLELAFTHPPGEAYLELLAASDEQDPPADLPPEEEAPDTLREERATLSPEIPIFIDEPPDTRGRSK